MSLTCLAITLTAGLILKEDRTNPLLWGRDSLGGILGDNLCEGNCESKIASRQWGDNFCRETSICLAGPSGCGSGRLSRNDGNHDSYENDEGKFGEIGKNYKMSLPCPTPENRENYRKMTEKLQKYSKNAILGESFPIFSGGGREGHFVILPNFSGFSLSGPAWACKGLAQSQD